jgi:hypothetical protein
MYDMEKLPKFRQKRPMAPLQETYIVSIGITEGTFHWSPQRAAHIQAGTRYRNYALRY